MKGFELKIFKRKWFELQPQKKIHYVENKPLMQQIIMEFRKLTWHSAKRLFYQFHIFRKIGRSVISD